MKKIFSTYLPLLMVILVWTSCEKNDNGDLDGMWYMTQMDSIATNQSIEMREAMKTWSFQSRLMQVFDHKSNQQFERSHIIMSHFSVENQQLIVTDPFVYDRMHGDILLTNDSIERLRPYGINNVPDTFDIEKLTNKKLQISNEIVRIYFDKY